MSKESIDKNPLRGMRDFVPQDWIFRKKLMRVWEDAAEKSGFVRYETPIVEPLSLLERKSGEEISEQIYNFEDKSGRKIALRPEITPSMVRIVSSRPDAFPTQGKVYSIGQCFRYERASLGRKREHFQWNIDIVGEKNVVAEAYLIKTAVEAMEGLGFGADDYKVRVNSRQLVSDYLEKIDIVGELAKGVMGVMDKKDKISPEAFAEMLAEIGVTGEQTAEINNFMAAKSLEDLCQLGLKDSAGLKALEEFAAYCKALGIENNVVIDPAIVRGLAYYTGIVFEAFDTQGKYRAIFGGGRYDNLFEKLTGRPNFAVGLGFGDVVVEELHKEKYPDETTVPEADILLGGYSEEVREELLGVFSRLRACRFSADFDFKPANLGKFLTRANKRNAKVAAYIGEIESKQGQMLLKNLRSGEQQTVMLDDDGASAAIEQMLAAKSNGNCI